MLYYYYFLKKKTIYIKDKKQIKAINFLKLELSIFLALISPDYTKDIDNIILVFDLNLD